MLILVNMTQLIGVTLIMLILDKGTQFIGVINSDKFSNNLFRIRRRTQYIKERKPQPNSSFVKRQFQREKKKEKTKTLSKREITYRMGVRLNVAAMTLLVLFASHANAQVFDVTANGAKPNADSTQVSPN